MEPYGIPQNRINNVAVCRCRWVFAFDINFCFEYTDLGSAFVMNCVFHIVNKLTRLMEYINNNESEASKHFKSHPFDLQKLQSIQASTGSFK